MREIRMPVACESDAIELCDSQGWEFKCTYEGQCDNKGQTMMLAVDRCGTELNDCDIGYDDNAIEKSEKHDSNGGLDTKIKEYVVFTMCNGSRMYIAKNGPTFNINDAIIFNDREKASKKAYYMTKNGYYHWECIRVS